MCIYCAEAMALSYLSANDVERQECSDLRNRWSEPILLQEGEVVPAEVAPISALCLEMEKRWVAGEVWEHRLPDDTALAGGWLPPAAFALATDDDLAAAEEVLRRYINWARALPPPGPLLWEGGYEKVLTDSFTTVWAAWLLISLSGSDLAVRECAVTLAHSYFLLTDEALELWLQRRAVLRWHDLDAFDNVARSLEGTLQPRLARYVAMRRPPTNANVLNL